MSGSGHSRDLISVYGACGNPVSGAGEGDIDPLRDYTPNVPITIRSANRNDVGL